MLRANKLTMNRQGNILLDNVSCEIGANQLVALVGHNGSGKSTLIKALAGEMTSSSGSITLDDTAISDYGSKELACQMAYLPQQLPEAAGFTVRELVMLGRYPHQKWLQKPTAIDKEKVAQAMKVTQVEPFADRITATLSGGERARAWLAMCLAQDTRYLLLDEPLAALDMHYQIEVIQLIRRLVDEQGLSVVIIIHDINLAAQYADRVVALKKGQVCHNGDVSSTMQPEVLHDIFNVDMQLLKHPVTGQPVAVA
ncbi:MAG: ABC transporter ATP-binding protein [Psychrobacter sp.]|uniref:ABC transporter ATP-binding protein n=1 Tax=Psychrobacter sp. TaxID=56811 RepID=UPI002649E11F|nr:ABC transporter ATP-binding protein [Psychrobacter sp.]MDN6275785.1 ABC transporter ATP-binding protein [Psychrobacter sp.]MDN6308121.1 ABC transporter ATP-binding protein [Psychrobacter sp.]